MSWWYQVMSGPAPAAVTVLGLAVFFVKFCEAPTRRRERERLRQGRERPGLPRLSEPTVDERWYAEALRLHAIGALTADDLRQALGEGPGLTAARLLPADLKEPAMDAGQPPATVVGLDGKQLDTRQQQGVQSRPMSQEQEWDAKLAAYYGTAPLPNETAAQLEARIGWDRSSAWRATVETAGLTLGLEGNSARRRDMRFEALFDFSEAMPQDPSVTGAWRRPGERERELAAAEYMSADPATCGHLTKEDVTTLDGTLVGYLCPACGAGLPLKEGK